MGTPLIDDLKNTWASSRWTIMCHPRCILDLQVTSFVCVMNAFDLAVFQFYLCFVHHPPPPAKGLLKPPWLSAQVIDVSFSEVRLPTDMSCLSPELGYQLTCRAWLKERTTCEMVHLAPSKSLLFKCSYASITHRTIWGIAGELVFELCAIHDKFVICKCLIRMPASDFASYLCFVHHTSPSQKECFKFSDEPLRSFIACFPK